MVVDPERGPYTTITVVEYNRVNEAITSMRRQVAQARILLEQGHTKEALAVLRAEDI